MSIGLQTKSITIPNKNILKRSVKDTHSDLEQGSTSTVTNLSLAPCFVPSRKALPVRRPGGDGKLLLYNALTGQTTVLD
jgi:hypothetical protein